MTFHLDPPPDFHGLDPHKDVVRYERNLPHWRQAGATYFVTFRLADSLPKTKLNELKYLREELDEKIKANPEMSKTEQDELWSDYAKVSMQKSDVWLDSGMGSCVLRYIENRKVVHDALLFFDGVRHETGAFVVMPNHVHALLRPFVELSLEDILHSIKRHTARKINERTGKLGALWQEESFDRIVRDPKHLWRCLQYIGANPAKAKLEKWHELRWVSEKWRNCGWNFEDGF